MSGETVNNTDLADNQFGIVAHNAYRLRRKVEMYQWHEKTVNKTRSDGVRETVQEYYEEWSENKIESSEFKREDGHENPSNPWPYETETYEA